MSTEYQNSGAENRISLREPAAFPLQSAALRLPRFFQTQPIFFPISPEGSKVENRTPLSAIKDSPTQSVWPPHLVI